LILTGSGKQMPCEFRARCWWCVILYFSFLFLSHDFALIFYTKHQRKFQISTWKKICTVAQPEDRDIDCLWGDDTSWMEGDYGLLWGDAKFRWMAILLHIKKNSINKEYMGCTAYCSGGRCVYTRNQLMHHTKMIMIR
jgi:hypothetical protein